MLAGAALLAGCQEEKPPVRVRPVLSVVVAPQAAAAAAFAGKIEPRYSSNLAFRVLGRVVERDVDTGDTVKRGQR
ncbi:hypothetical protein J8J27_31365, partial [Mycobacterium tuberculosis]|nr:hypothetical protein [Mycobacterium tuberculosis]